MTKQQTEVQASGAGDTYRRLRVPVAAADAGIRKAHKQLCLPEQDAISKGKQRAKLSVQSSRILSTRKISGHSYHDLRHTFCSDCKRRGIPTPHIAKMVGHSDEKTTRIYLH